MRDEDDILRNIFAYAFADSIRDEQKEMLSQIAETVKDVYDSYICAGFTERQATAFSQVFVSELYRSAFRNAATK